MRKYLLMGSFAGALLSTTTVASAAPITAEACTAAGTGNVVAVRSVAISPGTAITLFQTLDGTYQGQGTVEVYCRAANYSSLGEIPNAKVKISIDPQAPGVTASMFNVTALNGVAVADATSAHGNPVIIGPFTGSATFVISSPDNLLAPGISENFVGVDVQVVSEAWGGSMQDPTTGRIVTVGTFGDVFAQTPELDSLALFGSGAVGMLGYGLTRLRARRGRK
jgi:hypothetical protein